MSAHPAAIVAVRYIGPTNHRPSRLKVYVRGMRPLTYSYHSMDDGAVRAMEQAARKGYATIYPRAVFTVREMGSPYGMPNDDSLFLIESAN